MKISILAHFVVFFLLLSNYQTHSAGDKQSYIVYMGEHESTAADSILGVIGSVFNLHLNFLASIFPHVEEIKDLLVYSYHNVINGFVAMLDDEQAEFLANHTSVVSVLKNTRREMETTHSWDFLGLETKEDADSLLPLKQLDFANKHIKGKFGNWGLPNFGQQTSDDSLWVKTNYGDDLIIGVIDSGIWPEAPSFNDDGLGPIPTKWTGTCEKSGNMVCNRLGIFRKLIGAKSFFQGYEAEVGHMNVSLITARDNQGHGTHTSSIAAGSYVPNVNVFGIGNGTAKGGAPKARIAVYKVCWPSQNDTGGCFDADILAAFDAAIYEGVDVISISLGGSGTEMYMDATALGSYHAANRGIVVVSSAGNDGQPNSVKNVAPWMITVGASTTDRDFSTYVNLGNNMTIKGKSLSDKVLPAGQYYPLIRGADAKTDAATAIDGDLCKGGALDPKKVNGKILVCLRGQTERVRKGYEAAAAGAVGMILINDEQNGNQTLAESHLLPASHIGFASGQLVYAYIDSAKYNAIAYINPLKIEYGTDPAPQMASFTSRGPNPFELAILKPDITAPGVDIIAAYPKSLSPSELESDPRRFDFNVMSGTSMSCPHITAIAALIKAVHPNWSPAAIKSAIMTTATTQGNNNMPILDSTGLPATPFAYGSGHVRADLAVDPGLVYDLTPLDYQDFFCNRGSYPLITRTTSSKIPLPPCGMHSFSVANFNYPSISVPNVNVVSTVTRKVKNVGTPATYTARVEAPPGIAVTVEPETLIFSGIGEEQTFTVSFKPIVRGLPKDFVFGRLTWSDGTHNVSSPLVVKHA
ncbi:subtilisin-like protease SBT5.3 [Mercurialis annua]|uniref:subtilisin-like protease SBT5.3 n=1 Tax=Mercurialis annua TaxID=3986 RepID=UPI0024AE7549|nr:subtilisin-like protease SBT5.3 [Mercurialis annua]